LSDERDEAGDGGRRVTVGFNEHWRIGRGRAGRSTCRGTSTGSVGGVDCPTSRAERRPVRSREMIPAPTDQRQRRDGGSLTPAAVPTHALPGFFVFSVYYMTEEPDLGAYKLPDRLRFVIRRIHIAIVRGGCRRRRRRVCFSRDHQRRIWSRS
jgi:hypothetical protein